MLGKVGGIRGNSPQMVSIIVIMWEVRSSPEGKKGVGEDENVWLTVVASFTGYRCHRHHLWLHCALCAKSYINYSYTARL